MVRLALGVFLLFGLVWLAAMFGPRAIEMRPMALPPGAMTAIHTGAGFAATLAGHAMGLSAAAMLAFAVSGRGIRGTLGWGWLCLLALPLLAALSVLQFDPRLLAAADAAVGPIYNDVRAALPQIRLALFLGVCLISACASLSQAGGRLVALLVVASWAAMAALAEPAATAILALPALATLGVAALRLSEADRQGAAYIMVGSLCLLAGLGLAASDAALRADLRPVYLLFPLMAAATIALQPRLPPALAWGHALLLAFCLAYLAPALGQFGDVRPALTFAEIGTAVARATTLREGIGGIAVLSVLLMLGAIWQRRTGRKQRMPAPETAPLQAAERNTANSA